VRFRSFLQLTNIFDVHSDREVDELNKD